MRFAGPDRLLRESTGAGCPVPGAVLLVRRGEEVVFRRAYGVRQEVPDVHGMREDTVFDLASLTKPLCTGLLAMRFHEEGRLDLAGTLPRWFGPLPDPEKARISVRHLLANRSGLSAWRPFYAAHAPGEGPIPRARMAARIFEEPLAASPGAREIYSDLGYMLLGWILEDVGGLPLDVLFEERIARPLGLVCTGYRRRRLEGDEVGRDGEVRALRPAAATELCPWRGRVVVGEVHDENAYALGGVAGHAGLFSSADEVDRVVAEIFAADRGRSALFGAASLRAFLAAPRDRSRGTWALGWDTPSATGSTAGTRFSERSFGHTGFTGTSLWMDMERRVAVVLLTNRVHPSRSRTAIRRLRPAVHDAVMESILTGGAGDTETAETEGGARER